MVIRIGESSTAADRHETRVTVFGEDHSQHPSARICWWSVAFLAEASATRPRRTLATISSAVFRQTTSGRAITASLRACGPLVLAVPPVVQPDAPVAPRGAGDQVELVGLGVVVEQPGALAGHVGEQFHVELVDQVEPHE